MNGMRAKSILSCSRGRRWLRSHDPRGSRRGLSQIEVLVAAALLTVGLGVVPSLGFHLQRIQKETRNYQLAVHELANQLDRLTVLPQKELQESLNSLRVSDPLTMVLDQPTLHGRLVEDDWGVRVELSMQWNRSGNPPPLQLVAWVTSRADSIAVSSADTDSGDAP